LAPFFENIDEPDSIIDTNLSPCVAYIEEKKGTRNVFSNYTSNHLQLITYHH
jgi:hypothetical protein